MICLLKFTMLRSLLLIFVPVAAIPSTTIGTDGALHVVLAAKVDGTDQWAGDAFYAVNTDGSTKWTFNASGLDAHADSPFSLHAHAEGSKGLIYVSSKHGTLYALDSTDGSVQWQHTAANSVAYGELPVASDGTVYFHSRTTDWPIQDTVEAVDVNGALKWTIGSCDFVIDPDRGMLLWEGRQRRSPSKTLKMISVEDGTVKWSWLAEDASNTSPYNTFLEDGSVLVMYENSLGFNSLLRLSGEDGSTLWKIGVGKMAVPLGRNRILRQTKIILGNGVVYMNGLLGENGLCELRAFDFDGSGLHSMPCLEKVHPNCISLGGALTTHLVSTDNVILMVNHTCADDQISVLASSGDDGALLWQVSPVGLKGDWPNLALGQDGTVFAMATGGGGCHTSAIRNGQVAWTVQTSDIGSHSTHPKPLVADDGTTYIVGFDDLVAVGSDGLEKWRYIAAPAPVGSALDARSLFVFA